VRSSWVYVSEPLPVVSERSTLSSFWKSRAGAAALIFALALASWLLVYGAYLLLSWLF
jgi:Flp pilus assembly protein TadG